MSVSRTLIFEAAESSEQDLARLQAVESPEQLELVVRFFSLAFFQRLADRLRDLPVQRLHVRLEVAPKNPKRVYSISNLLRLFRILK